MNHRPSRRVTVVLTMCLLWLIGDASVVAAPGDVATSFGAPCRYPTGIASDGTHFYIADWRDAQIHRLDLDGMVLERWDAPVLKPHGLTWGNGLLYVSDDHTGWVSALNPETGVVENLFEAPDNGATGLAWAGDSLFILAGRTIYRVLPEDGTILATFGAPTRNCRCLAFDGTYLWVSDRVADEIYMVDPQREKVVTILPAPGPYATGIAWLDGRLWNVDFQTRRVYEVIVEDDQPYRLSDTRRARVEYLWSLTNYGPGSVTDLTVSFAVPEELPNQQLLSEPQYSVPPTRMARDRWDQPCAAFPFDSVAPGESATLTWSVEATISAIDYLIVPERIGSLDDIPPEIHEAYTADDTRYRLTSDYTQNTVKKIVGDETNPYWIARRIYDYIIDHLEYQMIGGWDIPEVVLKRGSGSCSEYTYAFIALCRAAGIPARYQGSIVVRGDDASIDEAFHRWAQVYLPNLGWVPVDANRGDKPSPADQARAFGQLSNRFLITTHGGGGSEHLAWGYNVHADYKTTGYCNISEEHFGFFEPLEEDESASETDVP